MSINNLKNLAADKIQKVGLDYWARKIMRETGWTPEQLAEVPIPVFMGMIQDIQEENKRK